MTTETATELDTFASHGLPMLASTTSSSGSLQASTRTTVQSTATLPADAATTTLRKGRSIIVITQLAGINFITSFTGGLITVGLPAMAADLALKRNLLVWPISVFYLTSGTCLLIAGTVADVIGPRSINLAGCFFLACFMLACGLARTGIELIMFRAMQGIAIALVVPSSISIVSTSVVQGRARNIGFACLGMSMPLGFSLGLVLGGLFVSNLGWRVGFFIGGALALLLFVVGIWALPRSTVHNTEGRKIRMLATEIDWVGAALASGSIASFSYVLAMLSADVNNISKASNIALLCISIAMVPGFIIWMHLQEKRNKPALISNKIWKNMAFSSVCIMVLIATAVTNCMELFSSLFFQEVQGTSALGASLRMLPNLILGIFTNLGMGMLVDRLPAIYAVLVASALNVGAPLLMAVINPRWPYWYDAFFAQLLSPLSTDVLFTVGLLIISASFSSDTQALAGAVFNTASQLGSSIGLTVLSVISTTVTKDSGVADLESPRALMEGYRASFWTLFGMMAASVMIGGFGLRKLGKVGEKRD